MGGNTDERALVSLPHAVRMNSHPTPERSAEQGAADTPSTTPRTSAVTVTVDMAELSAHRTRCNVRPQRV